ncbi:MAG TPA: aldo/keto reductase [Bacteroidota bacterium]|nr:aldo/keto reductase [Bacteroidota bacterium]
MHTHRLGCTDIAIPPIIFGTSALGNLYKAIDRSVKQEIVRQCFVHVEKPVVFDCAGKYGAGLALEMLGECLQALSIDPTDVVISNKLGWMRTPLVTPEPQFESGVWMDLENDAVQSIGYDGILSCFEQGNELLGGRYTPQLVSVHDPDEYLAAARDAREGERRFQDILDAYAALADLKAQGRVKAIGVGSKDWKVIASIAKHVTLDWVMFANSFTIMHHPPELLEFIGELHKKDVGIINSAVFHGGFLTGSSYFDYKPVTPQSDPALFAWRETFFDLCRRFSVTPAAACVNFGMTPPGVIAISLNTSNPLRVQDNVSSVTASVPKEFYAEMVKHRLIDPAYPHLGI